jgi:hypothetical protein
MVPSTVAMITIPGGTIVMLAFKLTILVNFYFSVAEIFVTVVYSPWALRLV